MANILYEILKYLFQLSEHHKAKIQKTYLNFHLDHLAEIRDQMEVPAREAPALYARQLTARVQALGAAVSEDRLAQEIAVFADRAAVDEELSRLKSHVEQARTLLESSEPVGKKLDFLIQEMNREANTIGSKASDAQIAQLVVDLKSEIEKLREQIQNVE